MLYGQHNCIFYAGEPYALKHLRQKYSNAELYIRKPIRDVNAGEKLFQGFLWALFIIIGATGLFVTCTKLSKSKNSSAMGDGLGRSVYGLARSGAPGGSTSFLLADRPS